MYRIGIRSQPRVRLRLRLHPEKLGIRSQPRVRLRLQPEKLWSATLIKLDRINAYVMTTTAGEGGGGGGVEVGHR